MASTVCLKMFRRFQCSLLIFDQGKKAGSNLHVIELVVSVSCLTATLAVAASVSECVFEARY